MIGHTANKVMHVKPKITRWLKMLSLGIVVINAASCSLLATNPRTGFAGTPDGVRSLGQMITDKNIERIAKANFYKLDKRFNYSRVNVNSFFGAVLLTGQVSDPYLRQLAEESVKQIAHVVGVHNYLQVANKLSYANILQDNIITTNATTNIMRIANFRSSRVSLTTEDGVVYVMGQLTAEESKSVLEMLQRTPDIKKISMLVDVLAPPPPSILPPLADVQRAQVADLVEKNTPLQSSSDVSRDMSGTENKVQLQTATPNASDGNVSALGIVQANAYRPLQASSQAKSSATGGGQENGQVSNNAVAAIGIKDDASTGNATQDFVIPAYSSPRLKASGLTNPVDGAANSVVQAAPASGAVGDVQHASNNTAALSKVYGAQTSGEEALPVTEGDAMPFMPEIKPLN